MWILLLSSLVLLGIFAFIVTKYQKNDGGESQAVSQQETSLCDSSEYCCGAHEICEAGKEKRKKVAIEYFDDEELDRFRNKSADDYTPTEIEEFKEILETLQVGEIGDWLKSLNARQISFPKPLIALLSAQLGKM